MKAKRPPTRDYSDDSRSAYSFGFPEKGKRRGMRQGRATWMAKKFADNPELFKKPRTSS